MAKKVKAEKAAGPAKIRLRMGKDKGLYALGKLAEAADELVTGAGPIRAIFACILRRSAHQGPVED
jgi:hypothetical protein